MVGNRSPRSPYVLLGHETEQGEEVPGSSGSWDPLNHRVVQLILRMEDLRDLQWCEGDWIVQPADLLLRDYGVAGLIPIFCISCIA